MYDGPRASDHRSEDTYGSWACVLHLHQLYRCVGTGTGLSVTAGRQRASGALTQHLWNDSCPKFEGGEDPRTVRTGGQACIQQSLLL